MMSGKIVTFHKTVRGHLHILKDIPCEDCSVSFSDKGGRYHIAAVADGHGDPACVRSAYGARTAVGVAVSCLSSFAETSLAQNAPETSGVLSAPRSTRQAVQQLTNTIISQWYQEIYRHLKENPLTEEDLSAAGRYTEDYRAGRRLAHVYGTTLIAALQLPDYLILLQQGDGRCDVFYADGSVDQPVPWDDRCFENVTTSLCDEDVASSIRHCVISLRERPVIACYMGSDGVEDSYRDMEGTHTFYRELSLELVRKEFPGFDAYLEEMLPVFSREGSGDDVSVAGIVDVDAIVALLPKFETLTKRYKLSEARAFYDEKICSMTRKHGVLKKRMEDARNEWEKKNAQIQQLRAKPSSTEAPEIESLVLERKQIFEAFQAVQKEFSSYDLKYRELLAKQKELVSQMDELRAPDKISPKETEAFPSSKDT